jgi:CheY-like chemotaxis protein
MDLTGKRILVVEDDGALAEDICRKLRELGATVLGPAPTPFYAMSLLGRRGVDGAVLDVRLHGATVFEVADELAQRGTPIVFAISYGPEIFPARHRQRPRVTKPLDKDGMSEIVRALSTQPLAELQPLLEVANSNTSPEERSDRFMRAIAKSMTLGQAG